MDSDVIQKWLFPREQVNSVGTVTKRSQGFCVSFVIHRLSLQTSDLLLSVPRHKLSYHVYFAVYQKHSKASQRPFNVVVSRNSDCPTIADVFVSVDANEKVLV